MSGATLQPVLKAPSGRAISVMAGVLLAAGLLYFSLRGIDWRGAWELIRHASFLFLVVCISISSGSLMLRALRWRVLLQSARPVSIGAAFWATSAGYFGNNFLPARAGELVRTFMISTGTGMSSAFVLTTALSERVSDAIALVAISAAVLLGLSDPPGWLAHVARPFAILGFCGVAAIALAPRLQGFGHNLLHRLPGPAPREKLASALDHIIAGIRAFHDVRRLLAFAGLTAAIWFCDATATIASARSLHLSFSYSIAFLLIAGLGLGSALPSTPGYVGIYQFVAVSVLVPFGFSRTEAIAYILLAQALSYAMIGCWGLIGFWQYRRAKRGAGVSGKGNAE